jgi:hypothetical protein
MSKYEKIEFPDTILTVCCRDGCTNGDKGQLNISFAPEADGWREVEAGCGALTTCSVLNRWTDLLIRRLTVPIAIAAPLDPAHAQAARVANGVAQAATRELV